MNIKARARFLARSALQNGRRVPSFRQGTQNRAARENLSRLGIITCVFPLARAFDRVRRLHASSKLIPDSAIYVDTYAYIRLTSANDTRRAFTRTHTSLHTRTYAINRTPYEHTSTDAYFMNNPISRFWFDSRR